MKRNFLFILFSLFLVPGFAQVTVTVSNPTSVQRQELVEVNYADVCQKLGIKEGDFFTVKNAIGQEVDYQISYPSTSSGQGRKLLLDASVQPNGSCTFTIEKGIPEKVLSYETQPVRTMRSTSSATTMNGFGVGKVWCHGQLYPDRLDDIAWENDRGAYRVYGPAFQQTKSIGYGPDVWVKNTPELVVNKRFRMDIDIKPTEKQLTDNGYKKEWEKLNRNYSFHIDHGNGNDCYSVGATLGCGAPAIIYKENIVYPYCWKEYEILDNGPLRFTVALTFNDTIVGKQKLTEHRIISLDKGSNFNKVEVWYETQELRNSGTQELTVVSGYPLHSPNEKTVVLGKDFTQYADPTDNAEANNCELYVACLYPETKSSRVQEFKSSKVTTMVEFGHALGKTRLMPGEHWVYYAGTAWSKYDVRNQQEWQCRVNTTLDAIKNPLNVTLK